MRDVLAVAGVIVVALGLGGAAAYMSVDLTPPGLDFIRPPKPAIAARIEREEKQRTIQAQASGCKYCAEVAGLAKTFSRRAETARTHAAALKKVLPQVSDETELADERQEELKAAQVAAKRAEAAAVVLTGWASRCRAEDFCKLPVRVAAAEAACAGEDDARPAAAVLIAMSVRKAAQSCAGASCPAVDCQATAALRGDIGQIEKALDAVGGDAMVVPGVAPAQLPVGPSTLKAELTRVTDETSYVTKMLPLLLDSKAADARKLPKMAPVMVDERAVSAAQLANVMEQAAAVADVKGDPRHEAAWRLRSLAANLAALGKDTKATPGGLHWEKVANSIGGALLDLARLEAMLDRVSKQKRNEGCDVSVAAAAQQLREATAMLDHCRMRSACVGRGIAGTVQAAAGGGDAFDRARAAADNLIVSEIGEQPVTQAAEGAGPQLIDVLRSRGVCTRAGDLREAAVIAPAAAQAVAEAAVAPALSPATGAVAPQDLVTNAMQAALDAPAGPATDIAEPAELLMETAAPVTSRFSNVSPRRKPRLMNGDPSVMQVAAPPASRPAAPAPAAPYQGVIIPAPSSSTAFGGEGGPQQLTPPPPEEAPKQP